MTNGKIWTVVPPKVGLPLLIGSVAVTSLIVHYAILTHTTWYPAYWNGTLKKAAELTIEAPVVGLASTPYQVSFAG